MKIKFALLMIFGCIIYIYIYYTPNISASEKRIHTADFSSTIPQVELYYSIVKYSKQYKIPEGYLFAIAQHESGYRGLNDINYKHDLTSSANAVGPMQVKFSTARMFDKQITYDKLKNNIDSNVRISAMLLRYLYDRYGDWQLAFGAYNTGKPVKNTYSKFVVNKNFNWE